jgi:hypothetical protein
MICDKYRGKNTGPQCVKDGNTSIQGQPHSGRPRTASTEPNKKRVDEIIKQDRCVKLDTTAKKQCSSGDNWKLRLLENMCPLGTAFTD